MASNSRKYVRKDDLPSGVYYKSDGYACFVCSGGVKKYLGTYSTLEEAVLVRENELKNLVVFDQCKFCGNPYQKHQVKELFCSKNCSNKHRYTNSNKATEEQYKHISNNWRSYFNRLITRADRKDCGLTSDILLQMVSDQDYRCAISGLPLTCKLEKGVKCWSNASIDRIEAGGLYSPDNIHLVCRSVNMWRSDMELDLFINVCRAVTEYQKELKLSG